MRKIFVNKKGTEWTVGKLLTLVLAVVLVVLIIWGISTNAFLPLKERFVGMYDNAMSMYYAIFGGEAPGEKIGTSSEFKLKDGSVVVIYHERDYCYANVEKVGDNLDYRVDFRTKIFEKEDVFYAVPGRGFEKVTGYEGSAYGGGVTKSIQPLYFKNPTSKEWQWSADKINWMSCKKSFVVGGDYDGQQPPSTGGKALVASLKITSFQNGLGILLGSRDVAGVIYGSDKTTTEKGWIGVSLDFGVDKEVRDLLFDKCGIEEVKGNIKSIQKQEYKEIEPEKRIEKFWLGDNSEIPLKQIELNQEFKLTVRWEHSGTDCEKVLIFHNSPSSDWEEIKEFVETNNPVSSDNKVIHISSVRLQHIVDLDLTLGDNFFEARCIYEENNEMKEGDVEKVKLEVTQ